MEDTKTITREEAFFLARRSMHNEERLKKQKRAAVITVQRFLM